jgi:hypothetical protein
MRLGNGSSLPWSNRFSKLLIEFTDQEGIFRSDIAKALYVNYSIRVIESSPYYKNIRNSIVLIDGMTYSEGLMLSQADYSSLDLLCESDENTLETLDNELDRLASLIPRDPDRPSDAPLGIMRSLRLSDTAADYNTADYVYLLLESLGHDTSAALATWESGFASALPGALTAAVNIASKTAKGDKMTLRLVSLNEASNTVSAYAFTENGNMSFVFVSHDDSPVAIKLENQPQRTEAQLVRYDTEGNVAERRDMKSVEERFNIMPGNVIIVHVPAVPGTDD